MILVAQYLFRHNPKHSQPESLYHDEIQKVQKALKDRYLKQQIEVNIKNKLKQPFNYSAALTLCDSILTRIHSEWHLTLENRLTFDELVFLICFMIRPKPCLF